MVTELSDNTLDGATPIATPQHGFKNFKAARLWAKANITGAYKNSNTNEDIHIAHTAIDKYLSASAVLKSVSKDAHMATLMRLPELIKTAILKERQKDKNNNPDIKEIQRFYGAIRYESNVYSVKITVKAYPTGQNKAYSYEVLK